MLSGNVADHPLREVLSDLAAAAISGCLRLDGVGIYLRAGDICAVDMPGSRRELGDRLVSAGVLGPEALAEVVSAQPAGGEAGIGQLLVRLGYVDQLRVDAFVTEQIVDGCLTLLQVTDGQWEVIGDDVPSTGLANGLSVERLLRLTAERDRAWDRLVGLVSSAAAMPALATAGVTAAGRSGFTQVSGDAWAVLCRADGERSVALLAADCGFTMYEATYVVAKLVHGGLIEMRDQPAGHDGVASWQDPTGSASAGALLSELSHGPAAGHQAATSTSGASAPTQWLGSAPVGPPLAAAAERTALPDVAVPAPRSDTDTASLMRELSYLGVDEPPAAVAPLKPPQRHVAPPRKRKGFFGR